jgi:hypothetical protein
VRDLVKDVSRSCLDWLVHSCAGPHDQVCDWAEILSHENGVHQVIYAASTKIDRAEV